MIPPVYPYYHVFEGTANETEVRGLREAKNAKKRRDRKRCPISSYDPAML
jgi:hypothetical protein